MVQIDPNQLNSNFNSNVSIPVIPELPSSKILFSRTKTEKEFFNLHPWPKGREFTFADRVYALITDDICDEKAPPMGRTIYNILRDVSILYAKKQKMSPQELGECLSALDEKIEEIRRVAPMNVAHLIPKCLYLCEILDSKGATLHPEVRTFLKNRLEEESPFSFNMMKEWDPSKEFVAETPPISTLSKVMGAGLVLLGCSIYGFSQESVKSVIISSLLKEAFVPSWAMLGVAQNAELFRMLSAQQADPARIGGTFTDALLKLASPQSAADTVISSLFDSGYVVEKAALGMSKTGEETSLVMSAEPLKAEPATSKLEAFDLAPVQALMEKEADTAISEAPVKPQPSTALPKLPTRIKEQPVCNKETEIELFTANDDRSYVSDNAHSHNFDFFFDKRMRAMRRESSQMLKEWDQRIDSMKRQSSEKLKGLNLSSVLGSNSSKA